MIPKDPSRGSPEEIRVQRPGFLGEQDGPFERILKERLAEIFNRRGVVYRAYLGRVAFGGDGVVNVVLGLRGENIPESAMVQEVGSVFASVFNAKEHLDIMFLTDIQEFQLRKVCRPFFERS